MRLVVTGAGGFLGSRTADVLEERGHEVVRVVRPSGREAKTDGARVERFDVGGPAIRTLLAGADAVLHFAGVASPGPANADPARAIRENAGTTLNLLEGCREHGAGLVYPSTVRAGVEPPPDAYAISKRLGEEACRAHSARSTVVRLTSVFGPGQVAWEGATGSIAGFAAAAVAGEPIRIFGDPDRERDFVYVDDVVPVLEGVAAQGLWGETFTLARGEGTPLREAAELVRSAAGTGSAVEIVDAPLAPGDNESYRCDPDPRLAFGVRPLDEGVRLYVDWLASHPAPQGSPRG